jgi:redox-sensitive bicupin YhaK (pirin superfamily)
MSGIDDATHARRPDPAGFQRLPARRAEIGAGFSVARALPTAMRRTVGAWCFLDHAGPAEFAPGEGMRVGPHPHIGLQTFTWMIEGEVLHHDSLGSEQVIRPGQVNLMTAGRGIAHSEESLGDQGGRVHAAQLWIALPDSQRMREPDFAHHPLLPAAELGGFRATLLVGDALGMRAPTQVYSPLVGIDLVAHGSARTTLALTPAFEHAVLCLRGSVSVEGARLEPDTLLHVAPGYTAIELGCGGSAQALVIGGTPFGEDVLIWWNFVARTQEEVVNAAADWNGGRRFGHVPGTALPRIAAPDTAGLRLKARGNTDR